MTSIVFAGDSMPCSNCNHDLNQHGDGALDVIDDWSCDIEGCPCEDWEG